MLVLITLVLSVIFVMTCSKAIKKYPIVFYIGGAVLTTALIIVNTMHINGMPAFLTQWIMPMFTKGIFAAVLWFIVAGIGALPNGSSIIKRLMPIRGELSIFSAIITLSHAVTYGMTYIRRLSSGNTKFDFMVSFIICLILMLIMIPLTVMSFKLIRKKMNAKKWKNIQKLAYLFYVLVYVHVVVIYLQKKDIPTDAVISMIIYSAMFFGYAYFRIRKFLVVRKKSENKTALNFACILPIVFTALCSVILSQKSEQPQKSMIAEPTESSSVVSQTESAAPETELTKETETIPDAAELPSAESKTETETDAAETTESTSESLEETIAETEKDPVEEPPVPEVPVQDPQESPQPEPQPESQPEPQPVFFYQNGTFTASSYGYDGDVTVTITIENDRIIEISAYSEESDTWYFDSAFGTIKDRILSSQSSSVDAVSGATYSSNAIMSAVQKALDSARN